MSYFVDNGSPDKGPPTNKPSPASEFEELERRRASHRRWYFGKQPKQIGKVIAQLVQRKGYAQVRTADQRDGFFHASWWLTTRCLGSIGGQLTGDAGAQLSQGRFAGPAAGGTARNKDSANKISYRTDPIAVRFSESAAVNRQL